MIPWQRDQEVQVLSIQSSCTCLLQHQPRQGCCQAPAQNRSPYSPAADILSLSVNFNGMGKDKRRTSQSI